MAAPPFDAGGEKTTPMLEDAGSSLEIEGAPGIVAGNAETALDAVPLPWELTARTLIE